MGFDQLGKLFDVSRFQSLIKQLQKNKKKRSSEINFLINMQLSLERKMAKKGIKWNLC